MNDTIQTNDIGVNTMKGAGVFLDSTLFTSGTGTYTLSYDVIADSTNSNKNARIWVGTSSSHDGTVDNGWGMRLTDINLGTPEEPWLITGSTSVATTFTENIDTSISGTYTLEFSYTAGEDVAIVLGSGNTDMAFDNLSITAAAIPEPSTVALLAGLGALAFARFRRSNRS